MKNKLRAIAALAAIPALALTLAGCSGAEPKADKAKGGETMKVTDVAGREVELPKKVERMVFGESRLSYASVLLNKENPTEGVVAWGKDLQSNAPDIYGKMLEKNPKIKDIPTIGSLHKGDIDLEAILKHKPQVMFISLDSYKAGKENGMLGKLDAAKLPYLVTDFRQQPVENTEKTVELLGKVTGKEDKAKEFIKFYKEQTDPIVAKGKETAATSPTTFIWRAPGLLNCCSTFAKSNFAAILVASGGKNLADTVTPQEGSLTAEAVINAQPDQVLATGGDWAKKKLNKDSKVGFLPLGYTIDKETATNGLKAIMEQPGFSELKAVKSGDVHGVYHQLYDSPWNFIAYQQFAKWSNPDAFKDVDTEKSWKDFHSKFLPWEPSGTFFVSLNGK